MFKIMSLRAVLYCRRLRFGYVGSRTNPGCTQSGYLGFPDEWLQGTGTLRRIEVSTSRKFRSWCKTMDNSLSLSSDSRSRSVTNFLFVEQTRQGVPHESSAAHVAIENCRFVFRIMVLGF